VSTDEVGKNSNDPALFVGCEKAKQLLDAFGEAVQSVLLLHEQQFVAIVEGDSNAARFDLLIHAAMETKQNAKYAYLHHLGQHRCSS
jgi:uncharacterized protein with GYD domain